MAVIFMGSTDAMSSAHTSRFIEPFLRWMFPHISAEMLDTVHLCIRKCGHLTEYGILAALLWRAIPRQRRSGPGAGDWRRAEWALLAATFYGATDEYHQSFVPSRGASVHDVMIDACGAAVVLTVIVLVERARRRSWIGRGRGIR
jgi:VanZ family protein